MLNVPQFRTEIVRPTLNAIGLWSDAAETLVLGTAIQESRLTFLRQKPSGPARGFYEMEPATHDDIWANFLSERPGLASLVNALLAKIPDRVSQLMTNLAYATAMCRIDFYRAPDPLPDASDIDALGAYYKRFYNTAKGAATAQEWAANYRNATQ